MKQKKGSGKEVREGEYCKGKWRKKRLVAKHEGKYIVKEEEGNEKDEYWRGRMMKREVENNNNNEKEGEEEGC